jgi:hypothetical protein
MDADPILGGHGLPSLTGMLKSTAIKLARKQIGLASALDTQSSTKLTLFALILFPTNAPTFGLLSAEGHPLMSSLQTDVAKPLCFR